MRSGGRIKRVTVGDYTYLEQNPNSGSKYAQLVKQGHKIIWIIHHPTGRYVGKVMDGKVEQLR